MDVFFLRTGVLSGTVIKLIAVVSMTIDHIGFIFFPGQSIFRILGRLAFPLFAYMIAEGCYYTKNKKKYLLMVLGIGVLCQIAMYIFQKSLELNIMFTLALGIVLIYILQWAFGSRDIIAKKDPVVDSKNAFTLTNDDSGEVKASRMLVFILAVLVSIFLAVGLKELIHGFRFDYEIFGILLPVVIYMLPYKHQKIIITAVWLIFLCLAGSSRNQWWSLFCIIPLILYNGKPGRYRMKYFFYLYYPIHLGILWGIKLFS